MEDQMMKAIAIEIADLDGEIAKVFSCPVCLNLFRTPKLIPKCGHSVCLDCVKRLLPSHDSHTILVKFTCPECRSENEIFSKDIEKQMKTNFLVQKAVELLKDEELFAVRYQVGDKCPHVERICKSSHKCPHCKENFCNVCLVSHLERVKMETKWIASRFKERFDAVINAESRYKSMKMLIEGHVKMVQARIESEIGRLDGTDEQCPTKEEWDSLMAEARRIGEEQLENKAKKVFELTPSVINQAGSMEKTLRKLNEMSPLYNSPSEFVEIYSKVLEFDKELFNLEELERIIKDGEIVLWVSNKKAPDGSIKNDIRVSLPSDEIRKPDDDESSEHWRLREAILGDKVETIRNMYNSLSPFLRPFVTEHGLSETPLLLAAENGSVEVVKFLVEEQHANLDCNYEITPLHRAVYSGNVQIVEYLLEKNPALLYSVDLLNETPLFWAVEHEREEVVEFLVKQKNVNVDHKCLLDMERTALHEAAKFGNLKFVKILVESGGANLFLADHDGALPIHLAASRENCDIVKYFVNKQKDLATRKDSRGYAPIHLACSHGTIKVIDCLLDFDPDSIEMRGPFNRTPLQVAAANGELEAVQLLVKRGANVYASSGELNFLAIHLAAYLGKANVVEFFVNHDPNLANVKSKKQNGEGETPLEIAIRQKHTDVVNIFTPVPPKRFKDVGCP